MIRRLIWLTVSLLGIMAMLSVSSCVEWNAKLAKLKQTQAPSAYKIDRDKWGVPTIYGDTDPATAFGLAYAHAEDDFATIQRQLLAVRAELGAVDGLAGVEIDYLSKLIDVSGQVERSIDTLSPAARAMARGYADGLNSYAGEHPGEVLHRRLFPVTEAEVVGSFVLVSPLFFGLDAVIGDLYAGRKLPQGFAPEERGSNAFAYAAPRTADGSTVLVSNSHQPWEGSAAWYEARVVSGKGWRMTGALFPGSPIVLMGHNDHLAWTNTVNRPDLVDVYKLNVDKTGRKYQLDGEWRDLDRERVWLKVRFGPFVLPVSQTVWRSVHGPVLKNENGDFAIRYAGFGEVRQLQQYYELGRTTSLDEWRGVMAMQAIPATNFIYADAAGNIAMLYNARFPKRSSDINWAGVLPGDRSDLIWTDYEPAERIPFLLNPPSGYIVNANNTPFLATAPGDELNPEDFADLVGIEDWVTNRIIRARSLIEADDSLTSEDIKAIKYDKGYDPASPIGRVIEEILNANLQSPDLNDAVALLRIWDWKLDGNGDADALVALMLRDINSALRNSIEPREPEVLIRDAADHLKEHFGRLDVSLGEALRLRRGDIDIPVFGGPDALRAIGWEEAEDGRLVADFGDSFLMFVRWAEDGTLSTESVQPFGAASGRPTSPHYSDQAELFASEKLKNLDQSSLADP